MIDEAPILNSTKMKAAYSLVRSRLMCIAHKGKNRTAEQKHIFRTDGIFASKQAFN